ncbi:unnamed protein product [Clonostachys rhizophaga]|uniref:Uncharacterized protein n=1 Tax=Clonostachys rhizophaga TaxID=160324 RepID=A0A9N9VMM1_9HYPO|nr:unnamed protein product [Clonostachys rhizophaga]
MEQSALFGDLEPESDKVPPGCGKHGPDTQSFDDIHIILPPAHLMQKHEPRLAEIHNAYRKKKTKKNRNVLGDYLDSNWKPNVTVIDLEFQRKREDRATGQPDISWSPYQIASELYSSFPPQAVQLVLGEMNDVLERLRYGLLRLDQKPVKKLDPSKFPDTFDNIDLSNIPLAVLSQPFSTVSPYSMRRFLAEYILLSDRATIESHLRTSLIQSSKAIEKEYHGMRVGPGGIVMVSGFEWHRTSLPTSILPANARMTRPELEHWLHSHFLKLCLPYPRVRFDPVGVLAPLNLTAFLHLISHVASLGYPLHWLSATLAAICSGLLARTRAGPPAAEITDEKLAGETYAPADVSVAPFAA